MIPVQYKAGVAALLLAGAFAGGWYLGGIRARGATAKAETALIRDELKQVLDEQAEDRKRAEALQRTLDNLPKSENRVRDTIKNNPSGCVLPPAVVDSLSEAVREANAARKVPGHP